MPKLLSFNQAILKSATYSKRHAMLGNGFSIACRPDIFVYGKLFERADFSKLSPSARKAFDALGTSDFERVIKTLRDAEKVLSVYKGASEKIKEAMLKDAEGLREVLVKTIASSHPERPGDITNDEYAACRLFLKNFNDIYTLNYDLLLYWTLMHTDEGEHPSSDDGFRKPDYDYEADYVTWEPGQSHGQNVWYLHGALHVFDTGTEIQKYTWVNTGIRLIEQTRDALSRDYFPLFVAEGTSAEKIERIRHSDYLAKAYRSFQSIGGALFIFGHSLASNDEHFLTLIEKGKVQHLFVGIFGKADSPANRKIIRRAERMAQVRESVTQARKKYQALSVSFFDSATAEVWG
ncbi:MAG: DUF4917 family protein [Desulfobaccales bacterium]